MELNPEYIHSIYLNDDISDVEHLPDRLWWNIRSNIITYPNAQHKFWTLEAGRDFLRNEFDADTLATFDTLVPLAYKSDFLRFALLYAMGGLYADMSVQLLCKPEILQQDIDLFILRDYPNRVPWIVSTCFIIGRKEQDIFSQMLSKISEHVRTEYYGVNPLCPTGPNLFGKILVLHGDISKIESGEVFNLNRSDPPQLAFRSPTGQCFGLNFKLGRGLASLGVGQSHDYNVAWRDKKIYGPVAGVQIPEVGLSNPESKARKKSVWNKLIRISGR
jgi:hypothetical protein